MGGKDNSQWRQQYHLRFTPTGIEAAKRNLGVVSCFEHEYLQAPVVDARLAGKTEVAAVGDDLVLVNQGKGIGYGEHASAALIRLSINGGIYDVDDDGIAEQ